MIILPMLTILTQLSYIVLAELGTPCWKFQLGTYLCMHDVLAFFSKLERASCMKFDTTAG